MILEESIETYLREQVKPFGARCDKCVNLTRIGWPDRTVQWPGLGLDLVELKKPGKGARASQERVHTYLAGCNTPVYLLNTKDAVDAYIICRSRGLHIPGYWSIDTPELRRAVYR